MTNLFAECDTTVCAFRIASHPVGQNKMQQLRKIITMAHNFIKEKVTEQMNFWTNAVHVDLPQKR